MKVHGMDGCRAGWVRAELTRSYRDSQASLRFALHTRFEECLDRSQGEIAAVDIPIGLLDWAQPGGRDCDMGARRVLGPRRATSVFSPPARPALAAQSFRDAVALNGGGMTIQAFNILDKIREVDNAVASNDPAPIYEAHPELAFMRLAGEPLAEAKKSIAGGERRRVLLESAVGHPIELAAERARLGRARVATDDLLDAAALTLTAEHIARREGWRLGSHARDARGREMAIYY